MTKKSQRREQREKYVDDPGHEHRILYFSRLDEYKGVYTAKEYKAMAEYLIQELQEFIKEDIGMNDFTDLDYNDACLIVEAYKIIVRETKGFKSDNSGRKKIKPYKIADSAYCSHPLTGKAIIKSLRLPESIKNDIFQPRIVMSKNDRANAFVVKQEEICE